MCLAVFPRDAAPFGLRKEAQAKHIRERVLAYIFAASLARLNSSLVTPLAQFRKSRTAVSVQNK
jgi:hypothetical protein